MLYKADLHIHSCLSPCGALEMSPRDIVNRARKVGLSIVALTDHNSALNCPAFDAVCREYDDISPLFGIEVTSQEEVHNLCLFDNLEVVLDFSDLIYNRLISVTNNPDLFGDQVYVNESDEILGEVELYLGGATSLTIDDLLGEVNARGGLFIPAHVDRASFSMASQLGFIPETSFDAIEISKFHFRNKKQQLISELPINSDNYSQITNSDSHYLESIGMVYTEFELEEPTISSIKSSLQRGTFNIWTPWTI